MSGGVGFAIAEARRVSEALLRDHPELAEDERAFLDTLDGETDALEVARRLVRQAIKRRRLLNGVEAEMADLSVRKARFKAQEARVRAAVLAILEAANQKKLEEPSFTVSLVKAREPQRVLRRAGDGPAPVPPPEYAADPEWDEDKVFAAMEAGAEIPGWEIVTTNPAPSLTIRTR